VLNNKSPAMTKEKEMVEIANRAECLYDQHQVEMALSRMAEEITLKLHDQNPIVLCVMIGALIPTGYLLTRLNFPLTVDYVHATRYQGAVNGGKLHWLVEPKQSLEGRTVLVVDDIMDGGLTLAAILEYCQTKGAKDVYSAVLVDKKRERESGVNFEPDFVGVQTENRFLFGFGLDYEEYLRNAPGIFAVANEDL
jgi:hypoxanthine phosphoribosyltransferase